MDTFEWINDYGDRSGIACYMMERAKKWGRNRKT
jgi:hypothetical protein